MADFSTGQSFRLIAVIILSAIAASGCQPAGSVSSTNSKTDSASAENTTVAKPVVTSKPAPFLNGWEKPALALLLSGEQHGYLEPCGCSETQSGGMARRADLVRMLTEERGWNVVGLDLGGTLKRSRRQDEIKFEKMFDAFKQMHYAAIGVGLEELKLGATFLLSKAVVDEEVLKQIPWLLSANVVLFDQTDLGWPKPFRIIEQGGVKVAVTSVIGLSLQNKVAPMGVETNIKILDPAEVVPKVIESMQQSKPDLMILLSHGNDAEAKQYAKQYPQFQIVLAAGGYDEPDGKPMEVGKTWVLNVGHKGKRVGVLGYYPNHPDKPLKFELIQLDKERFKNHPAMRALMKDYQQQLEDEGIAASDDLLINQHPSGHTYVGAEKCGSCHTKAYSQWKTTGHALAFTTLKEGPWHENRAAEKVDWIPRQFDPECLSCHVTGWHPQEMLRYGSGYVQEKNSSHLLGQQCENCHGPGSQHVSLEEAGAAMDQLLEGRRAMQRTVDDARKTMCIECHDPDNSPTFTPERFDKFWEQVKHPGRD